MGKKERKRQRGSQNNEEPKTATKRSKPDGEIEITLAVCLKTFWSDTQASSDKLFIAQRPNDRKRGPASWHVVQVDLEETNNRQAKTIGEYHVKYYVRNVTDSKKNLVRHCRFWPLLREIKQPSGEFGDIIVLRPNKVEETLARRPHTRGWCQGVVNLAEDGIVGPFNFSVNKTAQPCCISPDTWKALEDSEEATSGSVDIDDLNRITPLL